MRSLANENERTGCLPNSDPGRNEDDRKLASDNAISRVMLVSCEEFAVVPAWVAVEEGGDEADDDVDVEYVLVSVGDGEVLQEVEHLEEGADDYQAAHDLDPARDLDAATALLMGVRAFTVN